MGRFIFIRHGESALNALNRRVRVYCGQADTPLTQRGRKQARDAGRRLAIRGDLAITTAISSAQQRASQTLDLILAELPYPVQRLPDSPLLNERSLGHFEGRLAADVYAAHPQYRDDPALRHFDNDFDAKAPGGENLREVTERAWAVIEQLPRAHSGDVLIVSHNTVIRCILGRALQLAETTVRRLRVANAVPIMLRKGRNGRADL